MYNTCLSAVPDPVAATISYVTDDTDHGVSKFPRRSRSSSTRVNECIYFSRLKAYDPISSSLCITRQFSEIEYKSVSSFISKPEESIAVFLHILTARF